MLDAIGRVSAGVAQYLFVCLTLWLVGRALLRAWHARSPRRCSSHMCRWIDFEAFATPPA